MTHRQFYIQLGILTIAILLLMAGLHLIPSLTPYWDVTIGSTLLFVAISVFIWHMGQKAAMKENQNAFTSLLLVFIFGKMLLCIVFVLLYSKIILPETKFFLIPFFIVYLGFTVFETIILTKLARLKPSS